MPKCTRQSLTKKQDKPNTGTPEVIVTETGVTDDAQSRGGPSRSRFINDVSSQVLKGKFSSIV